MKIYKTIDLCAGIGGIRKGFELTGRIENVLSAENDKYACITYEHLYGVNPMCDVTDEDFKFLFSKISYDILLAGFPCQAFSSVGKREGFKDTIRGTIFFHIAELIEANRPKVFLLENVEGLINHKKGSTFKTILDVLINSLNYKIVGIKEINDNKNINFMFDKKDIVLNALDFGLPQNRPRVYIVGFDKKRYGTKLNNIILDRLPQKRRGKPIYNDLSDVLEENVDATYYLSQGYMDTLKKHKENQNSKGNGFGYMIVNEASIENPISNTLLATGGSGKERNLIFHPQDNIVGKVVPNKKTPLNNEFIRVMTPNEWGKLQGFVGYAFVEDGKDKFSFPPSISKTQQYKQLGNSVAIPVIEEIANYIVKSLDILEGDDNMKYNKGEWSEAYAFVKLLGDGKVYAADKYLNKIEDEYYPIIKIIRDEIKRDFMINQEEKEVEITDFQGNIIKSLKSSEFVKIADDVLNFIKNSSGASFDIPILEKFLNKLGVSDEIGNISFKSSSKNKSDFKMEIFDINFEKSKLHTFSLKSYLGGKPTLLNASKSTNFIYKINNINKDEVDFINEISGKNKLKERFNIIKEKVYNGNYKINFCGVQSKTFESNMRLIDSNLPYIISEVLIDYYSTEKISSIELLTERLIKNNPLGLSNEEKSVFYKTKIIELIRAATLGMMPDTIWDKSYEVTGGLLSVKYNGDVVCYHTFYSKEVLDDYLYENTKLETASTSRHKFGFIYENNGCYYFNLNLQVRII